MEDRFPLFDPNDDAARQEEKLRSYYEEFSANARKRLISKTIIRPTTVYDILYPQTRNELLSKNIPFNTNLEEDSKLIRDRQISKLIEGQRDVDKQADDFRKSLLARNKIHEDNEKLLRDSESFRENLLSKNNPISSNVEKDSEFIRNNNLSKNRINLSSSDDMSEKSSSYRAKNSSRNVDKEQDLLKYSEEIRNQFRKNDIHKNVSSEYKIEKESEVFRRNNLNKNSSIKLNNIDKLSSDKRQQELSKNATKKINLEEFSKDFRSSDISKNNGIEFDLLKYSEDIRNQFRKNDINKNSYKKNDLEKESNFFRKNNTSKNVNDNSDLEKDSEIYRNSNLSKNTNDSNNLNIEDIASERRGDNLSKNKNKKIDLENYSINFRKEDMSLNTSKISDIESESKLYRSDELSKNKTKSGNLEIDSIPFRESDLSFNKFKKTNLEEDSKDFRNEDLSKNKNKKIDLDVYSVDFRKEDLSLNKPKFSDLEKDSTPFRNSDLSFNKPKFSDLEKDSVSFRNSDLSFNKPKFSDLEKDSVSFREDDLSFNKPKLSNLEVDSVPFREGDLSFNKPKLSNLEVDSVPFREGDLLFNKPKFSDLEKDSTPYLYNNLSSNVPKFSDLEKDSVPFREDDLSSNVPSYLDLFVYSNDFRNDNLSSNVPTTGDLLTDSVPFRNSDLANNTPSVSNIASDSVDFRKDLLSKNKPFITDLLSDSSSFRDDAKSKNNGFGLLGVNIQGAGTKAFLGISRVFTQGILVRQLLFSKNKSKNQNLLLDSEIPRSNNIRVNRWNLNGNAYDSTSENYVLADIMQGPFNGKIVDYSRISNTNSPTANAIFANDNYIINVGANLQLLYGTSNSIGTPLPGTNNKMDFPRGRKDRKINNGVFSVDSLNPKGGWFGPSTYNRNTWIDFLQGGVTSDIRAYNQQRNAFNLYGYQPGNPNTIQKLKSYTQDGFQDLISLTIGDFSADFQSRTLTTPNSVIQSNKGAYYDGGNSDIDILRPTASGVEIGSAESMMAKTVIGNPFQDKDFLEGRRGVRHIVDTIKKSDIPLAKNYDPQNNRAYITGLNKDGSAKISRQRFTIANPYAPGNSGKLIFFIKNYSSGDQFYFPPYIKSISNTESANWNSTNFLGRPEAMYTYNNSSREASISFYVLTDYTQRVDIGRDWESESMNKLSVNISGHFTTTDVSENKKRKLKEQELNKLKQEQTKNISESKKKLEENSNQIDNIKSKTKEIDGNGNVNEQVKEEKNKEKQEERQEKLNKLETETAALSEQIKNQQKELSSVSEKIGTTTGNFNRLTNYSTSNNVGKNVYGLNINDLQRNGSEIVSKPEETVKRINTMKSNLMFQPAYFSGDKIDFVRKIEFLSKLTRPSANDDGSNTGFSFIKPPICHIHLGDWWNHDIVVNSVSYDYADAPWTLDEGRVQPMWALVTISFNVIGPFKAHNSRPPLSTDPGGMFSPINGL